MQLVVLLFDNKQFTELEFMTDNDLETSEVPLSVLFCIIEKNAFSRCKGRNYFLISLLTCQKHVDTQCEKNTDIYFKPHCNGYFLDTTLPVVSTKYQS